MGQLYGFDEGSAQRIADTVRKVDRLLGNDPGTTRNPAFGVRHNIDGVLTQELTRGSRSAPEFATIAVDVYDDEEGEWAANGETIEIQDHGKIPDGTTLPVGVQVGAKWCGGAWVLSDYDCDLEDVSEDEEEDP